MELAVTLMAAVVCIEAIAIVRLVRWVLELIELAAQRRASIEDLGHHYRDARDRAEEAEDQLTRIREAMEGER